MQITIKKIKIFISKFLPKNSIMRGATKMTGSTVFGQGLILLSAPILALLYSPEDFGNLAVFSGLLGILSIFVSFRYELSIPLSKDSIEAANITILCLLLVLINVLIISFLLLLFITSVEEILDVTSLRNGDYLWFLPLGMMLSGSSSVFKYWAIRYKYTSTLAIINVLQAFTFIMITFFGFKLGLLALLLGQLVKNCIGSFYLVRVVFIDKSFRNVTWEGIIGVFKRYSKLPLFTAPASLTNSLSTNLTPIILSSFFGATATGLYFFANRLIILPLNLISVPIRDTFISFGRNHNGKDLGLFVDRLSEILIGISFPIMFFIFFLGDKLIVFLFSNDWASSGEIINWFSVTAFFMFCNTPIAVFLLTEKFKYGFYMQINLLFLSMLGLFLGALYDNFMTAIILTSLLQAIGYFLFLIVKLQVSGANIYLWIKNFFCYGLCCFVVFLPVLIFDDYFKMYTVTASLIGLGIYFFLLIKRCKRLFPA